MKKRSTAKKVIAILLAIAMVPTLVPGIAFASVPDEPAVAAASEDAVLEAQSAEDEQKEETAESEPKQEEKSEEASEPAKEETQPTEETNAEDPEPSASDKDSGSSEKQEPKSEDDGGSKDASETQSSEEPAADETDADVEEVEESEEEDADAYPAASFDGSAGGVTVHIEAPEGALPEGTSMHVSAVSQGSVIDAVQDAVGGDQKVTRIRAVDITFQNKDGEKIEPKKSVSVSLRTSGMKAGREHKAFHITDSGEAEIVANASGGSASFRASDFSTYGVEESVEAHRVDFYADAGDTEAYETYYRKKGEAIGDLPLDPGREGATFTGWFVKGTTNEVTADTIVEADMQIVAGYDDMETVRFVAVNGEGEEETVAEYSLQAGSAIGTLPQHPFLEGHKFQKWVDKADPDTEVTADTIVPNGGLTVQAVFTPISIYDVTVKYYYVIEGHPRVDFDQDTFEIEPEDVPYEITPPASTQVDATIDPSKPTYYPSEPSIQVTSADLENAVLNEETGKYEIQKEVQYVEYTAEYDFVYYLKDLNGNGYSEIERTHVLGVLGSTVTPTVRQYDYAEFERTEATPINRAAGIEIPVYYTRKDFTLSYDTNGGSYVPAVSRPYGTQVAVSETTPTRTGYTFQGWFLDEAMTQPAGTSLTLEKDTVLYAKWQGKQVNYTIVYMVEKYDNATGTTTWVYDNSATATAEVGTTVNASSVRDKKTKNGYEPDTARNDASSVEIAADGSSVLRVYNKLIRYTLVFNINNNNGRITMGGQTYTGRNYRIEDVVLGQDISSQWPSSSTEISATNRYFDGWTGAGTTYITKRYELIYSNVSNADDDHVMTYTASWSTNTYNRDAEYWLQQPDGSYKVEDAYTQRGLNTNNLGAKDIAGYDIHSGTPSGYDGSGNATHTALVNVF